MNTNRTLNNVLGWYGVIAILAAYASLTFGLFLPVSPLYHLLNLTGSAGIIVSSSAKRDWQASTLNVVFCVIAVIGLISALR